MSEAGTGALTKLIPDAPINLANDATTTDASQIRFIWQDGVSNGGTEVIDYTIFYDQGLSTYMLLESNVMT